MLVLDHYIPAGTRYDEPLLERRKVKETSVRTEIGKFRDIHEGVAYRMLDCYSGKMLCAAGIAMLGVPRQSIRTKNKIEYCYATPSTDNNVGPGYLSDCTDMENPAEWCPAGASCTGQHVDDDGNPLTVYANIPQPHPKHPGPGHPWNPNLDDSRELVFGPDGDNQCKNFLKVQNIDGNWYYITMGNSGTDYELN